VKSWGVLPPTWKTYSLNNKEVEEKTFLKKIKKVGSKKLEKATKARGKGDSQYQSFASTERISLDERRNEFALRASTISHNQGGGVDQGKQKKEEG